MHALFSFSSFDWVLQILVLKPCVGMGPSSEFSGWCLYLYFVHVVLWSGQLVVSFLVFQPGVAVPLVSKPGAGRRP